MRETHLSKFNMSKIRLAILSRIIMGIIWLQREQVTLQT